MKIAFVSQPWNTIVPPFQSGSIVIWTHEIARRLARSCEVTVYGRRNLLQGRGERYEGVQYRRIGVTLDTWRLKFFSRFPRWRAEQCPAFASRGFYPQYIRYIAKDLRRQQCDIVHIHNFSQFVPVIKAFNPQIKIVLHMHCEWLTQLDRAMIAKRLQDVDVIIGVSRFITDRIRKCFPEFAHRCQTVYNGVDTARFVSQDDSNRQKTNRTFQLLYVGRVSPEKGVHVLLDAFQKVTRQCPDIRLQIVGTIGSAPLDFIMPASDNSVVCDLSPFYRGSYKSLLESKLSSDWADHVSFVGPIPHTQLMAHFRAADVFLHPSVWGEPFPLAVLEAMASGLPIVATRVGGLVESIVDGKTGLLVAPCDASALAEAMLRLHNDDALRLSMGRASRKRAVELFSWERTAETILARYTQNPLSTEL